MPTVGRPEIDRLRRDDPRLARLEALMGEPNKLLDSLNRHYLDSLSGCVDSIGEELAHRYALEKLRNAEWDIERCIKGQIGIERIRAYCYQGIMSWDVFEVMYHFIFNGDVFRYSGERCHCGCCRWTPQGVTQAPF